MNVKVDAKMTPERRSTAPASRESILRVYSHVMRRRCLDSLPCGVLLLVALLVGAISYGVFATNGEAVMALYGRLIDGTGRAPIENGVVVIQGDRILSAGCVDDAHIPGGARRIEFANATLLPGFINTHVHRSYDVGVLRAWAASGVTTVRDLGAAVDLDWDATRDALEDIPACASLIISGPFLTVPGGYAVRHPLQCARTVESLEAARIRTEELIADGVDVIKIGIESDGFSPDRVMSLDVASEIVRTAHDHGVQVVAHVTRNADLLTALEAGVDQIGHMVLDHMANETIQRMAEAGIIWIPTLDLVGPSGSTKLRLFVHHGGIVALGTDAGAMARVDTDMPVREMERMMRSGMSAMQTVIACTKNAAFACGLLDEIGTLEPGKRADVLVVAGNPLEEIDVLNEPLLVLHEGTIVVHEES